MAEADVLVVGGGIVGTCAAIRAAEGGARVTVVDAGQNAGSTTNAGSLHVQLQSRFFQPAAKDAHEVERSLPLYLAAVAEWDRLDAAHGPFGMAREGGLMLAETEDQLKLLVEKSRREERHGLDVEILDRPMLDRVFPGLGPQVIAAELCRDEGKLNPLVANARLRAHAQKLGVRFVRARIARIRADGPQAVAEDGTVHRAQRLVVAAAWGTGALLSCMGLAIPSNARPLHMNVTEPAEPSIPYLVQHTEKPLTLKQLETGQVVIGGGWPAVSTGDWSIPRVTAGRFSATLPWPSGSCRRSPGCASFAPGPG